MLTRRQRLYFWLHEARMPKEKRRTTRVERRGDMTHVREEKVANLGRAEGEGHYSRAADFHRE